MKKITLRHISLLSLFKFGLVVGLALNIIPTALFTIIAVKLARAMNQIFNAMVMQLGAGVNVDLIDQLGLKAYADFFQFITNLNAIEIILFALGLLALLALYNGLITMLGGALFNLVVNLAGGMEMTVSEGGALAAPLGSPAGAYPAQASGAPYDMHTVRAQPQASAPRLEVNQPFQQNFPLNSPVTMVGSGPNCAIRLNGLPAAHFQISMEGGQAVLRDLCQGQVPVQVQGHAVQGANLLKDGFVIQTGGYIFTYRVR